MKRQVKNLVLGVALVALALGVLAAVFALPLWALWPWGPRVIGAPALGYVTIFCTLMIAGVLYVAVYLGGTILRRAVDDALGL